VNPSVVTWFFFKCSDKSEVSINFADCEIIEPNTLGTCNFPGRQV
jgi:hypothetical protein